jgi:hypothetical protein
MISKRARIIVATSAILLGTPTLVHAGCRVRMFQGEEWITCFVGSTACTTIWEGSQMIAGPVCETVLT